MTVRCWLSTSSYLRTFLRISKFCCSTWVCALRMALVTIFASIGTSSGSLSRFMIDSTHRAVEPAHQVVAEGEVEPRLARVALTAGPAAQLVVDAAGLVPLGAQHVEPAGLARPPRPRPRPAPSAAATALVPGRLVLLAASPPGSSPRARSSRSARNSGLPPSMMSVPRPAMLVATVTAPGVPGLRDDRGLALVLLGVEHLVRDPALQQQLRQVLGLLDARGADQHRLAGLRAARRCRRRPRRTSPPPSCRSGRAGRRGPSAGSSGSGRRPACRSGAARRPRSGPCRSSRRASRRAGSSSAG